MTTKTNITLGDGQSYEVDVEAFSNGKGEAFDALDKIEEGKAELKAAVEALADASGIKKGTLSKYLKAKHAAKIAEAKTTATTFEALESVR